MDDDLFKMSRRDHPGTSFEAAESIIDKLAQKHADVLNAFKKAGPRGLTDHALDASYAGLSPTLRPRRVELTRKGLIVDSGRVAVTSSQRNAIVWVLAVYKNTTQLRP